MVLHNLFLLLLEKSDVSKDCSGDGTGYSLRGKHYRSEAEKNEDKYRYVFRLVDLQTGMYVGCGYSNKSERADFGRAGGFAKSHEIPFNEVRLDKYYSTKKDLQKLGEDVEALVLPKKNLSNFGYEWLEILNRIKEDSYGFQKEYFSRNFRKLTSKRKRKDSGRKFRNEGRIEGKPLPNERGELGGVSSLYL